MKVERAAHPRSAGIAAFERTAAAVNNWTTWGPEDELGTVNYITPDKVAAACRLVTAGRVIQLGVPLDREEGPQATAPRRYNPIHFMDELPVDYVLPGGVGVADDVLVLPLQTSTQWDSLAHVSYQGRLYGGRDATLVTSHGALRNSIRAISGKVITRGVLADVARQDGVATLAPGQRVTVADLDATLRAQRVEVREGDVLLVRTGFMAKCRAVGWQGYHGDAPGLAFDTVEWLHRHRVAAVATDTASLEVKPFDVEGIGVPFHAAALTHMGLLLGEIFDLDELAADCARDGRYEFLFTGGPMPVTGGVGSFVNPYAVK
ncbi:MAG TPA: cyclase family protein [Candidatus Limnocylindria bacterium]|nr:cyclase family protein [Candidatus Limnocylindria bacterium]